MSQLILELVMVAASRPDLIRELTIWHSAVYITTGDEVITDGGFDISKSYLTDGRRILCERKADSVRAPTQVRTSAEMIATLCTAQLTSEIVRTDRNF